MILVEDPDDLEALDAAWEEEQITFGAMALRPRCGPGMSAGAVHGQPYPRSSSRKPTVKELVTWPNS